MRDHNATNTITVESSRVARTAARTAVRPRQSTTHNSISTVSSFIFDSYHPSHIRQLRSAAAATMSLVVQFLSSIRGFVLEQNGDELRNWLLVENEVSNIYFDMSAQLKSGFPPNSPALEKLVEKCLPEEDVPEGRGSPWPGFNSFMKEYLEYWRDVDFDDVVRLHSRLSDLLTYASIPLVVSYRTSSLLTTAPDPARTHLLIPRTARCCCKPACRSRNRCPSWL